MQIVSPKYDDCSKELFSNPIILKHFISDILDIPIENIVSIRILNPFLPRRYRNRKLGIVDILVELNDCTKINIEIQLKILKYLHKRLLFYLSKMYISDLLVGENYSKLKRCISISIVDFDMTDGEDYHSVYHLKDKNGHIFSDMFEIHILELRKPLNGNNPMDDWIRLFNAQSKEDLDMIKTQNPGIIEAIREIKRMSLSNKLTAHYEAFMKTIRDQKARDEYVLDEGIEIGIKLTKDILTLSSQGLSEEEIAKHTNTSIDLVHKVLNS